MRLIDADELIKSTQHAGFIRRSEIEAAPTVDAVPVVQCRMCKHWTACESEENDCDIYGVCNQIGRMTMYDWFCADGVRKDDGDAR